VGESFGLCLGMAGLRYQGPSWRESNVETGAFPQPWGAWVLGFKEAKLLTTDREGESNPVPKKLKEKKRKSELEWGSDLGMPNTEKREGLTLQEAHALGDLGMQSFL